MRYLTTTERENIAAWTAKHRPELIGYRDRVRVATFPQPQPKPMTQVELDEHVAAIAGDPATMPPGPPLNLTTRSQRRQVCGELVAFTVIGAGALIGFGILAWAVFSIVRQWVG